MDTQFFETLLAGYNWHLSLLAMVLVMGIPFVTGKLLQAVPTIRSAATLNRQTYARKMERKGYAENQAWNRKWGFVFLAISFGAVVPFCITAEAQPWWRYLVDMVVILMVYDFFYYLVHRFLFHDGNFLGGPLMWVHAVHHRQHNPCRGDSSFIHPIEVAMGLGLYVAVIFVLSRFMGDFHVATIVITWIAFSEINLHNHDLWESDKFPFKYLAYASEMHHHHHARFTGGNFATITLLFDWMFGTYDRGNGYRVEKKRNPKTKARPKAT